MLLERDDELGVLRSAAADAAAGRGRLVVLEGAPGIGKSALLAQVRTLTDAVVLTARGSDLEAQFPFGVVRQLFEPVLSEALLAGAARQAAPVFSSAGAATEMGTLHGLYWLTANLCERPAVLVVDDLHWADAASLRFLVHVATRLDGLPLLVAAAARAGSRGVDPELYDRLFADAVVVRPAPLSERGSAELLVDAIGGPADPAFVAACVRATAGNPLLLRALARAVRDDGLAPTNDNAARVLDLGAGAVSRLVTQRLARLRPTVWAVARAIAVLGLAAPPAAVRALAGVDGVTAQEAVATLGGAGLLRGGSFVHPLVAAAVYADMSVRERAAAHVRAADALSASGAAPEVVAAHLLKAPAGADPFAVPRLRRAASVATARGSAEAALAYLRRCLDEDLDPGVRAAVLAEAAELAVQVNLPAAVGLLDEAVRSSTDPVAAARLGLLAGNARGYMLDPQGAYAALTTARDRLPAAEDDLRRRIEATLLVGAFVAPGRAVPPARVAALAALPPAEGVGARMLSAAVAAHEMARRDPAGAARAHAALADGVLVRVVNGEGALVCGWLTLIAAGDPLALSSLDAAVAQAHRNGSLRALSAAFSFRALGRLRDGQLIESEADAREALRMTRTGRVDLDVSVAGAYLAGTLVHQGRLDEAAEVLTGIGVPAADPADRPRYYALDAWAELLLVTGRPAQARAAADDAARVWRAYGFDNPAVGSWRTTGGLAAHAMGDVAAGAALLRAEVGLAREWGAARPLARALRALGTVTGDAAPLREAVQLVGDGAGGRLERAYARFALGAQLRRSGARTEARELLGLALDEADVCGAGLLARWAPAARRLLGLRPRRYRVTGPAALTPGELRVATLASSGASNREIAQALFVTTKTVEVHLSAAYRKLGIPGRPGLAAALGAG